MFGFQTHIWFIGFEVVLNSQFLKTHIHYYNPCVQEAMDVVGHSFSLQVSTTIYRGRKYVILKIKVKILYKTLLTTS